jgi:hypothetical protein
MSQLKYPQPAVAQVDTPPETAAASTSASVGGAEGVAAPSSVLDAYARQTGGGGSAGGGGWQDQVGPTQQTLASASSAGSLSVGGTLPGGLCLGKTPEGGSFTTTDPTAFSMTVGSTGVTVQFQPGVHVSGTPLDAFLTGPDDGGGFDIRSLGFSFADAQVHLDVDLGLTGTLLDFIGDVTGGIEAKFTQAIAPNLPIAMRQPGYNPYADPDLQGTLQQLASDISSAFASAKASGQPDIGPDLLAGIDHFEAQLRPKEAVVALPGGWELLIGPQASLGALARLQDYRTGNPAIDAVMGNPMDQPRLSEIVLNASGLTLRHAEAGEISDVVIRRAVLGSGMVLQELDVDVPGAAAIGKAVELGLFILSVRTGQNLTSPADETAVEAARLLLRSYVSGALLPVLREQIVANDQVIPGISLTSLMGVGDSNFQMTHVP